METIRVQRWVISILLLTICYIWASGMVIGAVWVIEDERPGSKVGMLVLTGVVSVGAIIGVRLVNRLRWLTPWLLVGLVLPAIGIYLLTN